MRKVIVAVLTILTVVAASPAGAGSGVNRKSPPRVSLRYLGEVEQRARPYTYCWGHSNEDGTGTGKCVAGFPRYPRAVRVPEGSRLVLRIHYPAKPDRWFINAYRAIVRHEHYDETVGNAERIPYKLRPHRVQGTTRAWQLIFRVEEPMRHYYLDTGGDLRQGDAFYSLHVRTT